ncbi:xanthine dehydrogenase accessory protein XdhC [Pseudoxanthobacter sp.]|uniref:xanthine dehydrogenase accessory protein XdhC n=1 Tax=Pseudoxanthobacter sp. TaxID=1925742 RepID=UPI002FE34C11
MESWRAVEEAVLKTGRAALVTVVEVKGSSPREAGARLVVNGEGGFRGTIGGGALEWRAIAEAGRQMAAGQPVRLSRIALGPELGQCCGGQVKLLTEVFTAAGLDAVQALAARAAQGPFVTTAAFPAAGPLARQAGGEAAAGAAGARLEDGVLTEVFGERRRPVWLFGAGHVGRALVMALAPLPVSVVWLDTRPEAFPAHVPSNVSVRVPGDPAQALAQAPAGTFAVVMTHSHALDLAIVDAALARPEAALPYVGLIGSATKRARFESRLAAAGHLPARIAGLVCPIGGTALKSKLPAMIAAATTYELLVRDEALKAAGGAGQHEPPAATGCAGTAGFAGAGKGL